MSKERVVSAAAIWWLDAGVVTSGFAAQNVANPSQKGSLLTFPRIDTTAGLDTQTNYENRVGKLKGWAVNAGGNDQGAGNLLCGTAMVDVFRSYREIPAEASWR
jgi:hypothetical protein